MEPRKYNKYNHSHGMSIQTSKLDISPDLKNNNNNIYNNYNNNNNNYNKDDQTNKSR